MLKSDLITNLEESRDTFLGVLDSIPQLILKTEAVIGDWTVKDILAHLSRWEAEIIRLIWQIKQQNNPKNFHWDTNLNIDKQNQIWYLESKARDYELILDDYHSVRYQTLARIDDITEQDLKVIVSGYESKGKPLINWIAEFTFEHEREHLDNIQTWLDNGFRS